MPRTTSFFLILLRLAIGWHFFFEGVHKVHTDWVGQTETNKPFTSASYFREATGPLGPYMRAEVGDPDDTALARLTVEPLPKDATTYLLAKRLPAAVGAELDDYTKRFLEHYHLNDDAKPEKKRAEERLEKAKKDIAAWLMYKLPDKEADREKDKDKLWRMVKKTSPEGKLNEVPMAMSQRIAEYRAKLDEIKELRDRKNWFFLQDVAKRKYFDAKADAAMMRKELTDDLDKQVASYRDALNDILRENLTKFGLPELPAGEKQLEFLFPKSDGKTLPEPYSAHWDKYPEKLKSTYTLSDEQQQKAADKLAAAKTKTASWLKTNQSNHQERIEKYHELQAHAETESLFASVGATLEAAEIRAKLLDDVAGQTNQMKASVNTVLTDEQAKGAVPPVKAGRTTLRLLDLATMWGLTIMGACLMLGLFTRLNCVLAAGFLVLTYLAAPPWPWLPGAPNNEGSYLFVNKNLVELLALLVLATTRSGQWFGLDATLSWLFRRKPAKPKIKPAARAA